MKNIYDVSYKLSGKNNEKYILISDLHGLFDVKIAEEIRGKEDIKFVIISGDLLNGYEWNNLNKLKELKKFLNIISETHKVIMGLGNHDLWMLNADGLKNFKELENEKVYPLHNEICIIDNNRFTSFLPDITCYSYPKQERQETIKKLLDTYDDRFNVDGDSKYTEHLLSHNPYHFYHKEVIDKISKNYDLIETGHFHDGWIPTSYLDKNYDLLLDKGLQELVKNKIFKTDPNSLSVKPKRNLSRGVAYIYKDGYYVLLPNNKIYYYDRLNNTYSLKNKEELNERLNVERVPALVISGAVNTFLKLNMFYPYITNIELVKEENTFQAKSLIKEIHSK